MNATDTPAGANPAPTETTATDAWPLLVHAIRGTSRADFRRPSEAFDAIVAFADRIGHPRVESFRNARASVLTGCSVRQGKVTHGGSTVRWAQSVSLSEGWRFYVDGGHDKDEQSIRRDVSRAFAAVCGVWRALGGVKITMADGE